MRRSFLRTVALLAMGAMTACNGQSAFVPGSGTGAQAQMQMRAPLGMNLDTNEAFQAPRYRACPAAVPGRFECDMIYSLHQLGSAPDGSNCLHDPGCYAPSDLQAAYGITSDSATKGKGATVAVVDAYGYPTAAKDLALYRKFFKLPACGKGCLKIVGETGGAPPKGSNSDWDGEQALDLDMVSAICPHCKIVLVEANSDYTNDLVPGVVEAEKLAKYVSNSWGGPEQAPTYGTFDTHPGIIVSASAGDQGAGADFMGQKAAAQQPCSFQGVVCVGGTHLVLSNGTRQSESVWDDLSGADQCSNGPCATGSGCSKLVAKPSWQTDKGCSKRSATDISADADPYTGVVVALGGKLYTGDGGTSASSPMIVSMFALAGNASTAGSAGIWGKGGSSSFNAVTVGTNELKSAHTYVCAASILYICKAVTNMNGDYSGPAGWGTPNGLGAL